MASLSAAILLSIMAPRICEQWNDEDQALNRNASDHALLLLATGFGVGRSPVAPGTVGSLWGLLVVWAWQQSGLPVWATALFAVAIFLIGIPICRRGAELLGSKDPAAVVFDEIAAFPIVFAAIELNWLSALIGFLWFRLFDILKPWPCSRFDRLPGGLGIMADDAAAGVYAGVALWITIRMIDPSLLLS